jgi:hypothetical protein
MKRIIMAAVAAMAFTLTLAIPAQAGPSSTVQWVCDVPNGDGTFTTVTFVTASAAARHGIDTANAHAGQVFNLQFGEVCTVEPLA